MSLLGREYRSVVPDEDLPSGAPPRVALHGVADAVVAEDLRRRCHRLRDAEHPEVVVDLAAVLRCDRAALDVLGLLTGPTEDGTGTRFRVEGARWPQFLAALEESPLDELHRLCRVVDRLVPAAARECTPV